MLIYLLSLLCSNESEVIHMNKTLQRIADALPSHVLRALEPEYRPQWATERIKREDYEAQSRTELREAIQLYPADKEEALAKMRPLSYTFHWGGRPDLGKRVQGFVDAVAYKHGNFGGEVSDEQPINTDGRNSTRGLAQSLEQFYGVIGTSVRSRTTNQAHTAAHAVHLESLKLPQLKELAEKPSPYRTAPVTQETYVAAVEKQHEKLLAMLEKRKEEALAVDVKPLTYLRSIHEALTQKGGNLNRDEFQFVRWLDRIHRNRGGDVRHEYREQAVARFNDLAAKYAGRVYAR